MMDSYTFGDSKAAVNLATILQEPEYAPYARKASSILGKYFQSSSDIMFIPNKTTREAVFTDWRHKFLKQVREAGFPKIVETHIACVIVGLYRKCIKERKEEQ